MTELALAQRIENFLQGNWTGSKRIQGLQGGARAYALSLAARRANRPFLIVCPSAREAEYLCEDIIFFLRGAQRSAFAKTRASLSFMGGAAVRKSLTASRKYRGTFRGPL